MQKKIHYECYRRFNKRNIILNLVTKFFIQVTFIKK